MFSCVIMNKFITAIIQICFDLGQISYELLTFSVFCKFYPIIPTKQLCFMLLPGWGGGSGGGGINGGGGTGNSAGASRF